MARHGRHYNYLTPFFVRHTRRGKKTLYSFFLFLFHWCWPRRCSGAMRVYEYDEKRCEWEHSHRSHTHASTWARQHWRTIQWFVFARAIGVTHTHTYIGKALRAYEPHEVFGVRATKTALATKSCEFLFSWIARLESIDRIDGSTWNLLLPFMKNREIHSFATHTHTHTSTDYSVAETDTQCIIIIVIICPKFDIW